MPEAVLVLCVLSYTCIVAVFTFVIKHVIVIMFNVMADSDVMLKFLVHKICLMSYI